MQRDLAFRIGEREERDLGCFNRVVLAEEEAESVRFVGWVDGVVGDGDVHVPFAEVLGGDEGDAWWEGTLNLQDLLSVPHELA